MSDVFANVPKCSTCGALPFGGLDESGRCVPCVVDRRAVEIHVYGCDRCGGFTPSGEGRQTQHGRHCQHCCAVVAGEPPLTSGGQFALLAGAMLEAGQIVFSVKGAGSCAIVEDAAPLLDEFGHDMAALGAALRGFLAQWLDQFETFYLATLRGESVYWAEVARP